MKSRSFGRSRKMKKATPGGRSDMIFEIDGKRPKIGDHVFIAPTAVIIGNVEIHDGASIWYGTVLRGDMDAIVVGEDTNIQDNCTVHTDYGNPAILGDRVIVGHNAVIHGCIVEDECLIGIGAIVLTGAVVKKHTVVAAGSLILENQSVGPTQLVAGTPATVKRTLSTEDLPRLKKPLENYKHLSLLNFGIRLLDPSKRSE